MNAIFYGFSEDPLKMGVLFKKQIEDYLKSGGSDYYSSGPNDLVMGACFAGYNAVYKANHLPMFLGFEINANLLPILEKLTTETDNVKVSIIDKLYYYVDSVVDPWGYSLPNYHPCGAEGATKVMVFLKFDIADTYGPLSKYLLPRLFGGLYRLFSSGEIFHSYISVKDCEENPVKEELIKVSNGQHGFSHTFCDRSLSLGIVDKLDNIELMNKVFYSDTKTINDRVIGGKLAVKNWISPTAVLTHIDSFKE